MVPELMLEGGFFFEDYKVRVLHTCFTADIKERGGKVPEDGKKG